MSELTKRLLLKNKIDSLHISQKDKKRYLINCIIKSNVINFDEYNLLTEDIEFEDIKLNDITCKLCNASEFIKDKYTEICVNCGAVKDSIFQQKSYEKIELIEPPGSNLVGIIINGKPKTFNLNQIDTWVQRDKDPLWIYTKKIITNLNTIFQDKKKILPDEIKKYSVSLWYNFNTLYNQNYNNIRNKSFNKKKYNINAILVWCTYYGIVINRDKISLENLSELFNVNLNVINEHKKLFIDIFKNTSYDVYIKNEEYIGCNIVLSPTTQLFYDKIIKDLEGYDIFKNNYIKVGIIHYITNNINTDIKYTANDLKKKCGIKSESSITRVSEKISNFYNANSKKYEELFS